MVKIAILGFGVVGSGTAEVLTENKKIIEERLGCEYSIKYILDLRDFPDSPFGDLVVHDFNVILNDPEVSVVAEMMGGSHPAYDFSLAALKAGKHVVTSNKEVVSNFGVELCAVAAENGVRYLFEASVGGGIPVIRPMINDLASNKITKICGILNGTTNYILTKMRDDGASFEDVLKDAQKLGYAEANPSADVDGIDAARKIVILSALASGKLISPKTIYTEGITAISQKDIKAAEALGCSIKLIAQSHIAKDTLLAFVSPALVQKSNPLSRIDDVFNGILINANMVGEVMFYGPGAGKLPTASAVVADIIDIIANMDSELKTINWNSADEADVSSFDSFASKRVFITSKEMLFSDDVAIIKSVKTDDGFAYMTSELTELEVSEIIAKNKDIISSAFRVL